jgi:hypothetical protein
VALSSFFFHSIFVLASSVEIYIYTFLFFKASQDAFLNNQVKGIKKKKKENATRTLLHLEISYQPHTQHIFISPKALNYFIFLHLLS